MAIRERWGSEFIDNRDWRAYNEELVVRGKFYLDLKWVKSWDNEIERMNEGKRGAPYEFPESLIRLQAVWHQWIDYRGVEGITQQLVEYNLLPKYNDFSTINRRVNQIETDFILPCEGNVSVSCDGSGMKMNNGGEYRERKYGRKRKKYIKVTITADPIRKKLLDCDVSVEGEGDSEPDIAVSHIEKIVKQGRQIDKFWGDGAFDTFDMFDTLDMYDIDSAIKIRENATESSESPRRQNEVRGFKSKGYKKWARDKGYGIRWVGTEGMFSAVKRKFGETVRSTNLDNMLLEVKRKFWVYDLIQDYGRKPKLRSNS